MTVSSTPSPCNLPPLPKPIGWPVGFPSEAATPPDADKLFVTKTDLAVLADYLVAVRQWIEAASSCMRGMR